MSDFTIKPATRIGVRPLIALYAESGAGKTFSSLLLARGFIGPAGKICLVDSERGRGSLYADVLPGGYDVLQLEDPFSPHRYIGAMSAVESAGYQIGIMDSGSHEWEGVGGVLDMAAESEEKSGKKGLHNWKVPKFEHAQFIAALLRSSIPWIICLRAKYKSRQIKNAQGKTEIVKDDLVSPLQAEDFLFEMTAHGNITLDHAFHITKHSHPTLADCFPKDAPLTTKHGELLARWCAAPGAAPASKPKDELAELKKRLWKLTEDKHGGDKSKFRQWLVDEALIDPSASLDELTTANLDSIIKNAERKIIVDPIP